MMAIIRFIDFISLCLPARWFFDQWSTSRELREAQKELEELNDRAPLVVSQYYGAGIDAARKELLGPGAVLPRANVELNAAFGTLLKHDERVAARLNQAAGDADREPALRAAAERIARRKTRLRDAMDSVATTIAKTEAILEECAVLARKIEAPLADRELIREIECAEETEESAILTANLGIEAHLERVRQRVVELTSAIYSTPLALPAASSEERLESYFINVDAVAAKVNALG